MKQALILAGGAGRRLGWLGRRYPKIALPIADAALYELHLAMLAREGIRDVVIVVPRDSQQLCGMIEAWTKAGRPGTRVRFLVQEDPRGIAHALQICRPVAEEQFVVLLADTYLQVDSLRPAIERLHRGDVAAVLSVRTEHDEAVIRKECSILLDDGGFVLDIVEKPRRILSNVKPCGIYFFTREVFRAIQRTPPSSLRGEVELTDAIGVLARGQQRVATEHIIEYDINITCPEDFLKANLRRLAVLGGDSFISPTSRVHETARVVCSVIGPGAAVGENASIIQSVMLPGASMRSGGSARNALVHDDTIYTLPSSEDAP